MLIFSFQQNELFIKFHVCVCGRKLFIRHCCRDAVNEMSLHFLAKMKIMVVKDIEREDIEFFSRILGCRPVASLDHFVPEALGSADLVEEISTSGDNKIIQVLLFFAYNEHKVHWL